MNIKNINYGDTGFIARTNINTNFQNTKVSVDNLDAKTVKQSLHADLPTPSAGNSGYYYQTEQGIYKSNGSTWGKVGYTSGDLDALLNTKANELTTYTKTETNTLLDAKQATITASNGVQKVGVDVRGINATTSAKGVVQLSNAYNGTSQILATTEKALNDGLAIKQNTITTGSTAQYFKGDLSLSNFATDAQNATVEDAINNGVTNKAPSENAVFDALALKENSANKNQINGYAGLGANGLISVDQIPNSAKFTRVAVASQAARYTLTNTQVQNGDSVYQNDTQVLYLVKDDTNLSNANGYDILNQPVDWSSVLNKPSLVNTFNSRSGTVTSQSGDYTGTQITNTPAGNISATNVQSAINELDNEKQPNIGYTPENVANKENITLDTSSAKYPTNNLVKTYTDAKVEDQIIDGVTTKAPSQNAVFDALALKENSANKNQTNGYAGLGSDGKISTSQLRPSTVQYNSSTGVISFTWADGSTSSIDLPMELVFQSVNYDSATHIVTFTLVGGATTSIDLSNLVDIAEIQIASQDPVASPTTGQKVYVNLTAGQIWLNNNGSWVGDKYYVSASEKTVLSNTSGVNTGDQDLSGLVLKTTTVNSKALGSNIVLNNSDVGLGNVVNVDTTTTANITDSTDKRFITDAQKTVLSNTSGVNTGDQDLSGYLLKSDNLNSVASKQTAINNLLQTSVADSGKILAINSSGDVVKQIPTSGGNMVANLTQATGKIALYKNDTGTEVKYSSTALEKQIACKSLGVTPSLTTTEISLLTWTSGDTVYNLTEFRLLRYTSASTWVDGNAVIGDIKRNVGSESFGWTLQDGRALSRTTYSLLFAKIGVAFGGGDGSTTFNIPNAVGIIEGSVGQAVFKLDFNPTDINVSTNRLTISVKNDWLQNGTSVVFTTTGTAPGGLTNSSTYIVNRVSSTLITLSTNSTINYAASTAIDITSQGTGVHTLISTKTSRSLGDISGDDTHRLNTSEVGIHNHAIFADSGSGIGSGATTDRVLLNADGAQQNVNSGRITETAGSSSAFNIIQPTIFNGNSYIFAGV